MQYVIDNVMRREGGYSNHQSDRGGETRYGITKAAWEAYSMHSFDSVTESDAKSFYFNLFELANIELLPQELWDCVFDYFVHSGRYAIKDLQELAGVETDGVIGSVTAKAVRKKKNIKINFLMRRIQRFGRIVTKTPSQIVFLNGWLNRVKEFIDE